MRRFLVLAILLYSTAALAAPTTVSTNLTIDSGATRTTGCTACSTAPGAQALCFNQDGTAPVRMTMTVTNTGAGNSPGLLYYDVLAHNLSDTGGHITFVSTPDGWTCTDPTTTSGSTSAGLCTSPSFPAETFLAGSSVTIVFDYTPGPAGTQGVSFDAQVEGGSQDFSCMSLNAFRAPVVPALGALGLAALVGLFAIGGVVLLRR